MGRLGRRKWTLAGLGGLLLLGMYVSWQFGLFAQPHKTAPLVVPDTAAPGRDQGYGGTGDTAEGLGASDPTRPGAKDAGSAGEQAGGRAEDPAIVQGPRLNILLLGVDSQGEQTRSDILLLVSVDLANREAAILSIPRDTRVEIPERGPDKINHAHAFGGVDLALRTVANAFRIPIHHYVRIDMAGMVDLINQLGPITVDVEQPLALQDGSHLEPGPTQMDGELALLYLRERQSDPNGDVGRSQRAQDFLLDVARQLRKEAGPTDIPRFYAILRDHADTDIQLQDGFWQRALLISLDSVRQGRVQGQGRMIDGIYYYEVDWPATEQVLQSLHMKPPTE